MLLERRMMYLISHNTAADWQLTSGVSSIVLVQLSMFWTGPLSAYWTRMEVARIRGKNVHMAN